MVTMTSPEACECFLNGSFVCVEVRANNGLETTEGGTLWNLSDRYVPLRAPGCCGQSGKWSFFLCCCLSFSLHLAVVGGCCNSYVNTLITVWLCGGELHVPVSSVIFNWVTTLRDRGREKEKEIQSRRCCHRSMWALLYCIIEVSLIFRSVHIYIMRSKY